MFAPSFYQLVSNYQQRGGELEGGGSTASSKLGEEMNGEIRKDQLLKDNVEDDDKEKKYSLEPIR